MARTADNPGERDRPEALGDVLEQVDECAGQSVEVSIGDLVASAGHATFAPLILVPGLIMLAPGIGDIPGVPVLMGLLVILVVVQMLMGRRHLWLPGWLRRRSAKASRVRSTVRWMRKPARFLDRWSRRRLTWAVRHGGFVVIALVCIIVSMATPLMEVVPFSANLAGIVITAFGLALLTQDGLIALAATAVAVATGGLVAYQLL